MKNTKKSNSFKSNVVEKLSLEALAGKHDALARYLGVPCVVEAGAVFSGAVMPDGRVGDVRGYACYCVDLEPYSGEFNKVRFRAAAGGDNVAYGSLVDKDGNVDSVAECKGCGETVVVMPLNSRVKRLFATMPLKKGRPAWKNVKVELLRDGAVKEIGDCFGYLHEKICSLEKRIESILSAPVINVCIN
jgi:hypothetical protein